MFPPNSHNSLFQTVDFTRGHPKREIRSNGTTSMNSIRHRPYVLAHNCKCFEEIKRPLLGVNVSWLQHEVIVTTLKDPFFPWPVQREARACMCVSLQAAMLDAVSSEVAQIQKHLDESGARINEDAHLTVNGSTLNDERSPSTYVCVFV